MRLIELKQNGNGNGNGNENGNLISGDQQKSRRILTQMYANEKNINANKSRYARGPILNIQSDQATAPANWPLYCLR